MKVRLRAQVKGYAYAINEQTSIQFSLAILICYIVIATLHLIWLLGTGLISTSWDTMNEVITIALTSQPPPSLYVLQNTSAGISTIKTLKCPVRIIESGDGLELSLRDERIRISKRVKYNKTY